MLDSKLSLEDNLKNKYIYEYVNKKELGRALEEIDHDLIKIIKVVNR